MIHVDGQRVHVTQHAVEQFRDRCRPALDLIQAKRELLALLWACGKFVERPDWTGSADTRNGNEAWVAIGGDVALPVVDGGVIVTCLTRGTIPPQERLKRKTERADRRFFRRRRARRHTTRRYDDSEEIAA